MGRSSLGVNLNNKQYSAGTEKLQYTVLIN